MRGAPLLVAALLLASSVGVSAGDAKLELFVSDAARSVAFYRLLDFEIAHQKEDGYTTLRRGGLVLALSPLPSWLPVHWLGFLRYPPLGTELVSYVPDLEASRLRFAEAGADPGEIALQPWGDRDFRLTDPDGYYVRVSEGKALP